MNKQQSVSVPVRQTRSTTRLRHCEARRKLLALLGADPVGRPECPGASQHLVALGVPAVLQLPAGMSFMRIRKVLQDCPKSLIPVTQSDLHR